MCIKEIGQRSSGLAFVNVHTNKYNYKRKCLWGFLCVFQTNLGVISANTCHIDSMKYFLKKGKKIGRTRKTREN